MSSKRRICEIAQDIHEEWKNIHYSALPYLQSMLFISWGTEYHCNDSAKSIILYFLANAQTFRGEQARKLKAELKCHLN